MPNERTDNVPGRKRSFSPARPQGREPRPLSRQAIASILQRRGELVDEIARLRRNSGDSRVMDNAQQLLTRWWSSAAWTARVDLLKTVGWLVQVEKRRQEGLPSTA